MRLGALVGFYATRKHYAATPISNRFRCCKPYFQASSRIHFLGNLVNKSNTVGEEAKRGPDYDIMMQTDNCTVARDQVKKECTRIRKGARINLHDLLFTQVRDYLIRYNDGQCVKAEELAGKFIAVYCVPLCPDDLDERMATAWLIDTYNYLLPHNVFEVVLVASESNKKYFTTRTNDEELFESIFSRMPWTAIPFPDITSREHLTKIFGIWGKVTSFVIDPSGLVLQDYSCHLFNKYGGMFYPFTSEWIEHLQSQDDAVAKQPTLQALLASPERDYVISNKGDRVLIHTLEEKVVALYFYEEGPKNQLCAEDIRRAYEELVKTKKEFEVVLVYLHDTVCTCCETTEESFNNTFKNMPWLALPFRDPNYRKLKRLFRIPSYRDTLDEIPKLVIVGPHGEFIEPWGYSIFRDFNIQAYPFTRERVAQLETEKLMELNLEMLWSQNTVFRGKDDTEVRLCELAGKRIIVFFEGNILDEDVVEFLNMLKESYMHMKGTEDEFEVIRIPSCKEESPYQEHISETWLVSLASDLLPMDLSLYRCYCHHKSGRFAKRRCMHGQACQSSMLAFDRDGRLVRKSLYFYCDDMEFPFYAGDMEEDVFFELNKHYDWYENDYNYKGLIKNSFFQNAELDTVVEL